MSAHDILGALGGGGAHSRESSADPLDGLLDGLFDTRARSRSPSKGRPAAVPDQVPEHEIPDWSGGRASGSRSASASAGGFVQRPVPKVAAANATQPRARESSPDAAARRYLAQPHVDDVMDGLTSSGSDESPRLSARRDASCHARGASRADEDTPREEDPEEKRAQLVCLLCALQALRPSELQLLLSGWQQEWIELNESLCTPAALELALRMYYRKRPRRRRGGKRIAALAVNVGRSAAEEAVAASTAAVNQDKVPDVAVKTHAQLAAWRGTLQR